MEGYNLDQADPYLAYEGMALAALASFNVQEFVELQHSTLATCITLIQHHASQFSLSSWTRRSLSHLATLMKDGLPGDTLGPISPPSSTLHKSARATHIARMPTALSILPFIGLRLPGFNNCLTPFPFAPHPLLQLSILGVVRFIVCFVDNKWGRSRQSGFGLRSGSSNRF